MERTSTALALFAALLGACRTSPFDTPLDRDLGLDLARPSVADLAAPAGDLSCREPDLAMAPGACPCGDKGLCRPATGRLSVQTQSAAGHLAVVVMDDNGCNRREVSGDHPIGVPRWAADRERLAYLTGDRGAELHVLRVGATGNVVCSRSVSVDNVRALELAWASEHEVWLGTAAGLSRYRLDGVAVSDVVLPNARFDALGDGPLAVVQDHCGDQCASQLGLRPLVANGALKILTTDPMLVIGPIRLSASGDAVVFERAGWNLIAAAGGPVQSLGQPGDRSPAFALDGRAVVFATDDGHLRYHFLAGPEAGTELDLPATWQFVYSPDWSPAPESCGQPTTCL